MPYQIQRFILCLVTLLFVQSVSAQNKPSIVWHKINGGEWTRLYLQNSAFPHSSRMQGYSYKNLNFTYEVSYSDSSAIIFIPDGYRTVRKLNDVVVHFHGWNNEVLNVMHDPNFNIIPQFIRSNKNAILIFAQGPKNAMDSAGGKLETKNGLKNFIKEILNTLRDRERIPSGALGNLIISAHNGGYRPAILGLINGGLDIHIKELYLFDAFYDLTDNLIPWLRKDHDHRLRSVFTDHLAPEHRLFVKGLAANRIRYSTTLNEDINVLLQFSRVCHDCVMSENLEKWLKVSVLEDID